MVNLVHGITLNTSDEGMISAVRPSSYCNITVRATLSGIQRHTTGITNTTQIHQHRDVYYHNGIRDPITRTILYTYEYQFKAVQLNRMEPPYLKDAVNTITDDESFYMVTADRFYESKLAGFHLVETVVSVAVNDYRGITPAKRFDAYIWDPRIRNRPNECILNPLWHYPALFDRHTMTFVDDHYDSWERINCTSEYIQKYINPITSNHHSLSKHVLYLDSISEINKNYYFPNDLLSIADPEASSIIAPDGSRIYLRPDDVKDDEDEDEPAGLGPGAVNDQIVIKTERESSSFLDTNAPNPITSHAQ